MGSDRLKDNIDKLKRIPIERLNKTISRFRERPWPRIATFILLRIILTLPLMILLYSQRLTMSLGLFLLISLIGYINMFFRRKKDDSQIVSIMDPFADKVLIISASLLLWHLGKLPPAFFLVFSIKESLMIFGGLIILAKNKKTIFRRNNFDKWTTFFQSIALMLSMFGSVDNVILWVAFFLTIVSGIYPLFRSDVSIARSRTDLERLKLTTLISVPDYITFLNIAAGLLSIVFAIQGMNSTAMIMLVVAVVADYADGKVARALKKHSDFGKELDSLADTVSFGVAPAVFGFLRTGNTTIAVIAFTVFMFCGVIRLARFNIAEQPGGFEGMPITMNGIFVPLIYFSAIPVIYYPYIYLILGVLMVSSIRIRKI